MNSTPIRPVQPVTRVKEQTFLRSAGQTATESSAPRSNPQLVSADMLDIAREAPVDGNRIALIKEAIASGSYPIVPAKIADAMIAAGILLRTGK